MCKYVCCGLSIQSSPAKINILSPLSRMLSSPDIITDSYGNKVIWELRFSRTKIYPISVITGVSCANEISSWFYSLHLFYEEKY